jgi:hypothetical protein
MGRLRLCQVSISPAIPRFDSCNFFVDSSVCCRTAFLMLISSHLRPAPPLSEDWMSQTS